MSDLKENTNDLLKVYMKDVTLVWISEIYDGPLAGLLYYKEELCYFVCEEQNVELENPTWYRRFLVYSLTQEEKKYMLEMRKDFNEFVGMGYERLLPLPDDYVAPSQDQWLLFTLKYPEKEQEILTAGKKAIFLLEEE